MGEAHEEFRAAGADIVAVFQYRADPTFHFCRKRGIPFDCLGDPEREGYFAVGLESGSMREYMGPQLVKGFVRAARKGVIAGNPQGGDVSQRPGTFVVGTDGRIAFAHYNKDSADNPDTDEILRTLRELAAAS